MANQDNTRGTTGPDDLRRPNPRGTAQDPEAAETQRQVHDDANAIRAEAARVEATTPPEVRDRTVGQIVEDANRRAER